MFTVPAPRWRLFVLALVGCVAAALGGLLVTSTATANSPTAPVKIVIDSVTSSVLPPGGTPGGAVPYVLVKAGDSFSVSVSFYDASGNPASFNNDTTLAITSNRGTLTPSTGVAPGGATSATLTTSLATAANQVSLTVAVAGGKLARTVTPGTSRSDQLFDVLTDLRFENSTTDFQQGIGGDSNCTIATKAAPVCGIVILPDGAASSQVLLSLGACDSTYAACGSNKGSVVQALANLTGLYSKTSPATLLIKCDKSLCGGGAIQNVPVNFSLGGNAPLQPASACPAKGTIGDDQDACVDYVQSKRDGSGDSYLYLLFAQDLRGGIG
jgi:hypothetical protein